ncbi:MAG TPA: hypothetical protein VHS55_03095 [Solirubrobacteraceae bacterium]|nr:hypothetical protein [Solirubrobacteraceae bacterium]
MPAAKTTSAKPRASAASKRSTTASKPAARAASKQSSTAERAVLIPVGAALIARERVASGVGDAIANYNSTAKASAQLRKFERRGVTARNRVERELRKTRVRVERELRQRRQESEELANKVQERILSLV